MLLSRMHLVSVAMASALAVTVSAQCVRPIPPSAGLPVSQTLTVPVAYSDGYVSHGAMLVPSTPPPVCGWPLVVYVHRLGGSRFDELSLQVLIAEQGYAVWSYDVRAQGEAVATNVGHPNAGSTLWGPIERHDLAEQVAAVASSNAWVGVVDATRLAVLGTSQGAGHAWSAAAWSGELLTTSGRSTITFPVVSCALPRDLAANSVDDWLRHGELFSSWWLEALAGSYSALPIEANFAQAARTAFVTQDPASLRTAWLADGRDLTVRLAVSTVPVFYRHAYFDNVCGPLTGLARLESMQGPTRSMLSTLGHGVPDNLLERAANENLTLRWLHRFLWSESNEVEIEPRHQVAVLPLADADRDDVNYAWAHGNIDSLLPPGGATRLYLQDDFSLQAEPPAVPQADALIEQVIDPLAMTFNPTDYFDQAAVRSLSNVLAVCPIDERVWSMVVTEDRLLQRSAMLHLELVPNAPSWMIAASLTIEPVGGSEVAVASDVLVSRASVPSVAESHELRLPPVSVSVPAGSTIRLRLSNLWLHRFPMQPRLAVAPLFADFGVDIKMGGQPATSWLDLPLQPSTPSLVVDRREIDLSTMAPVVATIRGGAVHATDPYFVAVGFSGTVPTTNYLGTSIPLDGDWLVVASAASQGSFYNGFLGFLDANGEATCSFDYSSVAPLPQFLNGQSLAVAAFVWDYNWASSGDASNACQVMLR